MKIKRNIILMYAIVFFQGMVFYSAIATLYRQQAGLTVFEITIIESISLALALVFELPWGIIAEKIGYKTTMIICNVLYVVSKIVFWRADSFILFLIERIILSIVCAGLSGVDSSILYLSSNEDNSHKVFSIYENLGTFGLLLAGGIYTIFLSGEYRLTALCTIVTYGIAMILTFFLKEVKSEEEKKNDSFKEFIVLLKDTFKRKELFFFLIGIALFSECHQTICVFFNQLQYVRSGMNDQQIGFAYIVMIIAGLIGVRSAHLAKKIGRKKMGILLIFVSMGACLVLTFTSNSWISIGCIVLIEMSFKLMLPLVDVIENEQISESNRATALSIYSLIMDGVAIGTNVILGKTCDINLMLALGVSASFCFVALVLFIICAKKMKV